MHSVCSEDRTGLYGYDRSLHHLLPFRIFTSAPVLCCTNQTCTAAHDNGVDISYVTSAYGIAHRPPHGSGRDTGIRDDERS